MRRTTYSNPIQQQKQYSDFCKCYVISPKQKPQLEKLSNLARPMIQSSNTISKIKFISSFKFQRYENCSHPICIAYVIYVLEPVS